MYYNICDLWYVILSFLQNSKYELQFALCNKFFYSMYLYFKNSKINYLNELIIKHVNNDEHKELSDYLNTNICKYTEIIHNNYYKVCNIIDNHLINFNTLYRYNSYQVLFLENLTLNQMKKALSSDNVNMLFEYSMLTRNIKVVIELSNLYTLNLSNINAVGSYECIDFLYKMGEYRTSRLSLLINAFRITNLKSTLVDILRNSHCKVYHINQIIYNSYISNKCLFCKTKNIELCFYWLAKNINSFTVSYNAIVTNSDKHQIYYINNILKLKHFCTNSNILSMMFDICESIHPNCATCISRDLHTFINSDSIEGLRKLLKYSKVAKLDNCIVAIQLNSMSMYQYLCSWFVYNCNLINRIKNISSFKLLNFFKSNCMLPQEYLNILITNYEYLKLQ